MWLISWLSTITSALVAIHLSNIFLRNGIVGVLKELASFLLLLPGSNTVLKLFTRREIHNFMDDAFSDDNQKQGKSMSIPETGHEIDDLRQQLVELKSGHKDLSQQGRLFAYVYTSQGVKFELQKEAFLMFTQLTRSSSDENSDHENVVKSYLDAFMHDNALNPLIFPALRKFENEVVAMTARMLNGDSRVVGSVTSGGTESILMAMKTHRDRARRFRPKIARPNAVAPDTIHPAFAKAAHYFDVELKLVPVSKTTFVCSRGDFESAIDANTVLLLASAPSYPQGVLDPVEEISEIAVRRQLPLHVDACFGGFMMPWVERLPGREIPLWDFRLPGVTSISADLHKYGYATKGASVVCYRNSAIRKFQFFAHVGWPGGLFVSPTMAGTRPGGHLAAAWVALMSMGQSGYTEMAGKLMETTDKMKSTINGIDGLKVLGNPLMTAFSFASTDKQLNIFGLVDVMESKGWKMEVQRNPDSVHCTVLPTHLNSADEWLSDLKDAVAHIRRHGSDNKKGQSAIYGMLAMAPNDGMVNDFLVDLFDEIYKI